MCRTCAEHVPRMLNKLSFRSVRFNRGNGHQRRTGWRLGGVASKTPFWSRPLLRHTRVVRSTLFAHQGVVSLRHSHNFRFGQDDIFVSVKVKVQ